MFRRDPKAFGSRFYIETVPEPCFLDHLGQMVEPDSPRKRRQCIMVYFHNQYMS
jgi:hypothetical protein